MVNPLPPLLLIPQEELHCCYAEKNLCESLPAKHQQVNKTAATREQSRVPFSHPRSNLLLSLNRGTATKEAFCPRRTEMVRIFQAFVPKCAPGKAGGGTGEGTAPGRAAGMREQLYCMKSKRLSGELLLWYRCLSLFRHLSL